MTLKFGNCTTCSRPFLKSAPGADQCASCLQKEQQDFEKILKYLREQPSAKLTEICEATGAKESFVLKMLRVGRLQLADGVNYLTCNMCGKPIPDGRLCSKCAQSVSNVIKTTVQDENRGDRRTPRPSDQDDKAFWYSQHLSNTPNRRKGNRR